MHGEAADLIAQLQRKHHPHRNRREGLESVAEVKRRFKARFQKMSDNYTEVLSRHQEQQKEKFCH